MANAFEFIITTTPFDEDYTPSSGSRITTNFANLARGEQRQGNLRRVLTMIGRRFNELAEPEDPDGRRYAVELEVVSVALRFDAEEDAPDFPLLEMLDMRIIDSRTGERLPGIVGNSFSSYIRDFDFSVLLPEVGRREGRSVVPDDFGDLHGKLFLRLLDSAAYQDRFALPPVICISVSTSRTYRRTEDRHPVLGVEYRQDDPSLTDDYFAKMGMAVRYFMPAGAVAPLALYSRGDLPGDYSDLQLIGTISVMETFQRIYRPEIYNAHAPAGQVYRPSLEQEHYSQTPIDYDRVERAQLALKQGRFAEEHLLKPHGRVLEQWAAGPLAPVG